MESHECRSMGVKDRTKRLFSTLVERKTKANKVSCISASKGGQGNAGGLGHRSSQLAGEAGYSGGKRHHESRLLQPSLPREEVERGLASNYRFVTPKQVNSYAKIPDGNIRVDKKITNKGHVGKQHRFKGCLLPHPDTSQVHEVFKIYKPGRGLPVQGTALWTEYCSPGVYPSNERGQNHTHEVRSQHQYVSRRLAHYGTKPKNDPGSCRDNSQDMSETRSPHKSGEIGVDSHPELQVRGLSVPARSVSGAHTRGQSDKDTYPNRINSASEILASKEVHANSGVAGIGGKNDMSRPLPYAKHSIQFESRVEEGPESRETRAHLSRIQATLAVVDGGLKIKRPISPSEVAPGDSIHRQLVTGLGSPYRQDRGVRKVVPRGNQPAHQCTRDESSYQSPKPSVPVGDEQGGSGYVRQHHGGVVHKQGRRYSLRNIVARSGSSASMVSCQRHSSSGQTHKGLFKLKSRLTIKAWSDSQVRMGNELDYVPFALPDNYIPAGNRFICHEQEPQAAKLCVSHAGSRGSGHRRHVPRLDRHVDLCLSTNRNPHGRTVEDKKRGRVHGHRHRSSHHKSKLLPSTDGIKHRQPDKAKASTSSEATRHRVVPSERDQAKTTRLDFVRKCIIKKGFSARVAERISLSVRKSTTQVYDRKWLIFSRWCHSRQISPTKVHVTSVADFLSHLQDEGKAPSTVEGYRTAIAETLKYSGKPDISEDPCIRALIRSHRLARVVAGNKVPPWDLAVVLKYISQAPFEPIQDCEIKHLTVKTLFLLALASGKRRGELHALTREGFGWNTDKSVITLRFDPTFVAKTQRKSGDAMKPVIIHSLNDFVGNDADELLLCPARALLAYYSRVKAMGLISKRKKKLFVSIQKGRSKDICSATITRWLKWLILESHRNILDKDLSMLNVKAHQIRGVAASNAFKHSSLEQVMEMGGWVNDSTFTNFYLKDLSLQNEKGFSLTPVVTGNIITKV